MILIRQNIATGEIVGWMEGADTHELRRKAQAQFNNDLAATLYRIEFPPPKQTEIANDGLTRTLLLP